MEMQAPKGTKDMLPQDAYKWHFVEKTFRDVSKYYGMREIRTPMFEHTEVFARGVGDTTDIVQKEMYTFLDKGDRSILETIIYKFAGGPVGLDTLAAALGEDAGTLEDVYEPYLIQNGFIQRTPRGRVVTDFAYTHIGVEKNV